MHGQSSVLVTHKSENAGEQLRAFNASQDNWLVSVGMVSEGTNIPRLQVCCHLSRVKTELHFRQVLGRILRATHGRGEFAYMFILADHKLVQYARRIADDLPEEVTVVKFEPVPESLTIESDVPSNTPGASTPEATPEETQKEVTSSEETTEIELSGNSSVDLDSDGRTTGSLSLFGRFMEELITLQAAFKTP